MTLVATLANTRRPVPVRTSACRARGSRARGSPRPVRSPSGRAMAPRSIPPRGSSGFRYWPPAAGRRPRPRSAGAAAPARCHSGIDRPASRCGRRLRPRAECAPRPATRLPAAFRRAHLCRLQRLLDARKCSRGAGRYRSDRCPCVPARLRTRSPPPHPLPRRLAGACGIQIAHDGHLIQCGVRAIRLDVGSPDAGADHRDAEPPGHRRLPSRVAMASAFNASSMTLKQWACAIARSVRSSTSAIRLAV